MKKRNNSRQKGSRRTQADGRKYQLTWGIYMVLFSIIIPALVTLFKYMIGFTIQLSTLLSDYVLLVYSLVIGSLWSSSHRKRLQKNSEQMDFAMILHIVAIIICVAFYFGCQDPIKGNALTDGNHRALCIGAGIMTLIYIIDLIWYSYVERESHES